MKLTWLGHACFQIERDGYVLVIDPYADGTVPGLKAVRTSAHKVLCSHGHSDHAGKETVEILPQAEESLHVEVLDTFHDDANGTLRGPNKIFLITGGNQKIAHLGDLGCGLTDDQKEKLQNLDVLLIPVGGFFTIDGIQAANIAKDLNPRIVIPMHYRADGFGFDKISTVDVFADAMGSASRTGVSTIDTQNAYDAQVLILEPANRK